jgi:ParB-like chromosome segregation protein Spo0J
VPDQKILDLGQTFAALSAGTDFTAASALFCEDGHLMSKNTDIIRTVRWANDPTAEPCFKLNKVKPTVEVVAIENIENWKDNPARLKQGVNKEKVSEYSLAMKNGDVFPRPVLLKTNGKLYIAGGHHRIPAATEIGDTHIEAYIVETDDEFTKQSLPVELNIRHGEGYSLEERIVLAVDKVKNFSISAKDASRRYNAPVSTIQNKIRSDELSVILAKSGISGLSQTALVRLNVLGDNENLLMAAARLAKDANLTGEQIGDLVMAVRQQKSESAGIVEIEKRRVDLAAMQPASYEPHKRQPRTRLMIGITGLFNLVSKNATMLTYQLTTVEQQKIASEKLNELAAEIRSFLQRTKKSSHQGVDRPS